MGSYKYVGGRKKNTPYSETPHRMDPTMKRYATKKIFESIVGIAASIVSYHILKKANLEEHIEKFYDKQDAKKKAEKK